MKVLGRIFDFYLDASIHVALAVLALVQVTGITLGVSIDSHLSWFLLFGSIACYNFVKYGVEAEKYILVANEYHKNIQSFSFVAFGLAVYNAYFLSWEVWAGIVCLTLFTALYALPVLPHAKNLRSLGGLKIFLVAVVWAGATVILPVLADQHPISWDVWIITLQRFLFVLILMIPFEIRDLVYDTPDLKTLPQRFGVAKSKIFGAFLTLPFFFSIFLKDELSHNETLSNGILFLLLGGLILSTKRNQQRYFASFWVESLPLVWWGILLLLESEN